MHSLLACYDCVRNIVIPAEFIILASFKACQQFGEAQATQAVVLSVSRHLPLCHLDRTLAAFGESRSFTPQDSDHQPIGISQCQHGVVAMLCAT